MEYDFKKMAVGDRIACPEGKWGDHQRAVLDLAGKFANTQEPRWQFQTFGHEGSTFERGQYWIERTR